MKIAMFLCLSILSSPSSLGMARGVPILSYDQLVQKADVVLIVRPSETRDAVDGEAIIELEPASASQYLTAVVTPMEVLATIKGEFKGKAMLLPHYRLDWPKANNNGIQGLGNGPSLVTFPGKDPNTNEFDDVPGGRDCMLFLIKRLDGSFDFVTGQFDAQFSVFRLVAPAADSR